MFSQTELATRDELYIDTCPNAKTRTKIHLKVKARGMKFIRTLLCSLDFILNMKSTVECVAHPDKNKLLEDQIL